MKRLFLPFTLLCLLAACSMPIATPVPEPSPTLPSPSATPAPSPTPSPVELPLRVGAEKINCRYGPGVVYAFVNELEGGQAARAIGRNADSTWWYIRDPGNPGGTCWVAAQVTEITGGAAELPVFAPPPVTVRKIELRLEPTKIFVACNQFPQTVFFEAEITADGPTVAVWQLESSAGYTSAENIVVFEEAGIQVVNGYYQVNAAGDYWIMLRVLKPNTAAAQLNFPANCTP